MAKIIKQVRMVFDLNKCLGCQSCTMACKTMWTDRNSGHMYMYWNNVESKPGKGYPKNWETLGGWYTTSDKNSLSLPDINGSYGAPWEYNYDNVLKTEGGDPTASMVVPSPDPSGSNVHASNWEEDVGEGTFPNSYYFYLPRICNHCTKPACVAACPRQAAYKREEDGIVLIDQNRCRGYRYCVEGCPYKKTFYNPEQKISQKCIFCYPRAEEGKASFCFTQCVGRLRYVGYQDPNIKPLDPFNLKYNVNKLVDKWKVALRLHPEFKTEPNLFYIPPFSPPTYSSDGSLTGSQRIPIDVLARLFGDNAEQGFDKRVARVQEIFNTIETERAKVARGEPSELIDILTARSEADRLQLNL